MSKKLVWMAVILAVVVLLAIAAPGLAKKGPPNPETAGNNLSVPTIFVGGGSFTNVVVGDTDWSPLVAPTAPPDPLTGFNGVGIDPAAYYFVQGVHTWQAPAVRAASATGTADWGDNMAGDAKLKVGSPIRVELGLINATDGSGAIITQQGYTVVKLQDTLDRLSAYGTLAKYDDTTATWYATDDTMNARIWDAQATFSVAKLNADGTVDYYVAGLEPGANPTAEINATGKVVYGYNLRVSEAGTYLITFVTPNVFISGSEDGGVVAEDGHSVSLTISVIPGGGSRPK